MRPSCRGFESARRTVWPLQRAMAHEVLRATSARRQALLTAGDGGAVGKEWSTGGRSDAARFARPKAAETRLTGARREDASFRAGKAFPSAGARSCGKPRFQAANPHQRTSFSRPQSSRPGKAPFPPHPPSFPSTPTRPHHPLEIRWLAVNARSTPGLAKHAH